MSDHQAFRKIDHLKKLQEKLIFYPGLVIMKSATLI